jgi:hypothetical protein
MPEQRRAAMATGGESIAIGHPLVPTHSHGWLGLHHDQSSQWHLIHGCDERSAMTCISASSDRRFTKRYGLKILVYYEQHDDIRTAIAREKTIKHWPRAWKVRLIHAMNPEWKDLYDELF